MLLCSIHTEYRIAQYGRNWFIQDATKLAGSHEFFAEGEPLGSGETGKLVVGLCVVVFGTAVAILEVKQLDHERENGKPSRRTWTVCGESSSNLPSYLGATTKENNENE